MITGDTNVSYLFHMSNLIIVIINQEALKRLKIIYKGAHTLHVLSMVTELTCILTF